MNWLKQIFAVTEPDPGRVNPLGLILMAAAVAMAASAGRIAQKIRPEATEETKNAIKIIAFVICAGGALLAILG